MDLDERIRSALKKRGFELSELQRKAINGVLSEKNFLLIAPTGSGKTEAVMLPIFHLILRNDEPPISTLYITPLRSLNRDLLSRLSSLCDELRISIQVRHGDTPPYLRRKQAMEAPHILIITPETLQAILLGKKLRNHLKNVKRVVIDELQELIDSKRGAQLSIALERVREISGDFQRIGLSATVKPEVASRFIGECNVAKIPLRKKLNIKVISPSPGDEDRELAHRLFCGPELASIIRKISELVEKHASTLIFVNTRELAEALSWRLRILRKDIGIHHGSISRDARIEVEGAFKRGEIKALICTSSMELGIDIGDVDFVIQYSSPRQVTRLLQRVGRAGHRIGSISHGVIIASGPDDILESWVISRRAMEGIVEEISPEEKALDVLANQICGILLERSRGKDDILRIVRKSYPYRNLTEREFEKVISQLLDSGLVRISGNTLRKSGRTRDYFVKNLSMIPDEKRYEIYDVVGRRKVGELDESFVMGYASPNSIFITRGESWKIIEISPLDKRITVEPSEEHGEIPSWTGEEILVPREVANEVGELRERIAELLYKKLPVDLPGMEKDALEKVVGYIKAQDGPLPSDKNLVVETGEETVINSCWGHKVNETFGRILSGLMAAKTGSSITLSVDPYRIRLQPPVSGDTFSSYLSSIKPEYTQSLAKKLLRNAPLFKWKLLHVAKKFGAIEEEIDGRMLNAFENTPIWDESIREILSRYMDVEATKEMLEKVKGKIIFSSPSMIGSAGSSSWKELLSPERASRSILTALKKRIMNELVLLFCVACRRYEVLTRVKNANLSCPHCGSGLIAALKPGEKDNIRIFRKGKDEKCIRRIHRNARLVLSYGIPAVIALSARGVGPTQASKILMRKGEEFYEGILEAERRYFLFRRFWR